MAKGPMPFGRRGFSLPVSGAVHFHYIRPAGGFRPVLPAPVETGGGRLSRGGAAESGDLLGAANGPQDPQGHLGHHLHQHPLLLFRNSHRRYHGLFCSLCGYPRQEVHPLRAAAAPGHSGLHHHPGLDAVFCQERLCGFTGPERHARGRPCPISTPTGALSLCFP